MRIQKNKPLFPLTSFKTGGKAENYVEIDNVDKFLTALSDGKFKEPFWILGDGMNILVSDKGLPGTVVHLTSDKIKLAGDTMVIADAGTNWDEVVRFSIRKNLWGMELASGIPGSVGAAVAGNIAAYGHAVSDSLAWVEIIDLTSPKSGVTRLTNKKLNFSYHTSIFQDGNHSNLVIVRVGFRLSKLKTKDLEYHSAIIIADELGLDVDTLSERRKIIMETRKRAGSLYSTDNEALKTAGSFFRNPEVDPETAEFVMSHDEGHVAKNILKKMNEVHGGATTRVSAAHVLLAAGFHRGQTWGNVRLLPSHVLKIENTGAATSQEIYDVAQEIIQTVREKLDIELHPEVRFLGNFK